MKTIIVLLAITLSVFTFSFAEPTIPPKVEDVLKQLTFPETAKENTVEGTVLLSFSIDSIGRLSIREINSSNETLKEYIISKLTNLFIPEQAASETYYLKIDFKQY